MASTNSVKIYGHIVEWAIEDSSAVSEATSTLAWYSTSAPATKHGGEPASTDTWWMVKTITYIPSTAQTTGDAYVQLLEKDSSGPVLFHAEFQTGAGVVSQTYEPPLRCRPVWFTSKSVGFTTGSKWIFHIA